ncbi:hypothetical protein ABVK25_002961 [Lepraria finkii]|uniref:Uncharacterized protein n=1 Tax=Lepraria finkii TaxID=1340010 RepID=A0ABR4BGL2_9LECA
MASQGQAASSENQAFRVVDPSICTACGVEWSSNQKLRRKIRILENQCGILNEQLFRAGHTNQLNDLRIRTLHHEQERYAALAESSKQAAAGLQRHLDNQQATFEMESRARALAVQSLEYELARHEVTQKSLDHERAVVQKLTDILNKFEFPNGEIDLTDNIGLGTLFHEQERANSEVTRLQNELQHKQRILENLSGNFEIQSQSKSGTSFSDEEAEVAELQAGRNGGMS